MKMLCSSALAFLITAISYIGLSNSLSFKCPGDFGRYPHPDSCTMYLECNYGKVLERPCAPGTHWNQELGICDWPDQANCHLHNTQTFFPPATQETTMNPINTGPVSNTEFGKLICPNFIPFFEFPDFTNCSNFYWCVNGELTKHSCPSGLWYNFADLKCDYPDPRLCFVGNKKR